jgi:molybdopterin-guanine dinucleotide biosynthesis protein A
MDNHKKSMPLPMTGIILAGGKSSRMGRNKAFLEWEGQPLIERSLQALSPIFSELMISTNQPELYQKYGVKTVRDNYHEQGPLGGLEACLREASYEYSFFVACDMPFIDSEVICHMAGLIGEEWAVVPKFAGQLHPLHAFYHKNCLAVIQKKLEDKCLKLRAIFSEIPVRYLDDEDFLAYPQIGQVLRNINSPQDWSELQDSQA